MYLFYSVSHTVFVNIIHMYLQRYEISINPDNLDQPLLVTNVKDKTGQKVMINLIPELTLMTGMKLISSDTVHLKH